MLEVGDLRLDPAGHRAWRGDSQLELSAKELALLETFMRHPGQVLSRFTLLEHAWEGGYENRSNVVDVYVRLLREKIDRPFGRDIAADGARAGLPAVRALNRLSLRLRADARVRGRCRRAAGRDRDVRRVARAVGARQELDHVLALRAGGAAPRPAATCGGSRGPSRRPASRRS